MFIDLIEVRYGRGQYIENELTKWNTIEMMATTAMASENDVRMMNVPY